MSEDETENRLCSLPPEILTVLPFRTLKVWLNCSRVFSWSSSAPDLAGSCQPSWLGSSISRDVIVKGGVDVEVHSNAN